MGVNKSEMKRKRKEECPSPLLDDSPKRPKVHAQRKFAQGSNVNSPVITPVKEIEKQDNDVLPEPVELLPIKRPNTEDFLTFLCFRGTPILPPSLNFFNTASIVDTNGQVHEIKSESPKNGPIDTSIISKSSSGSSERPFVAFGVRKRADPIVISRQMDKKRRHALTLQALRRKYQEQRMAKIRAVTISKLSEKVTNKTIVRSNSVSKTETVTKKSTTIQKTKGVIVSTKRITTETVKSTLKTQLKPKMCLRSFRGRFVQKELKFRNIKKRPLSLKNEAKDDDVKKIIKKEARSSSEYSSDDEKPLKTSKIPKKIPKPVIPKVAKKTAPGPKKPAEINFRVTRSNKLLSNKITSRRQQIKKLLLLSTPKTIVKPRTLRSHNTLKPKVETKVKQVSKKEFKDVHTKLPVIKKPSKIVEIVKKDFKDNAKKSNTKVIEVIKKETRSESLKKTVEENNVKQKTLKKPFKTNDDIKKDSFKAKLTPKLVQSKRIEEVTLQKPEITVKKKTPVQKKNVSKSCDPLVKTLPFKKDFHKTAEDDLMIKEKSPKSSPEHTDVIELRTSQRPSRKTKEAAAIYMEILSHKLVNEEKIDDDNVSIDSFPELPNVKRTEQRENELKAKAKNSKSSETEGTAEKKLKEKEISDDAKRSSDTAKENKSNKNDEEQPKSSKLLNSPSESKTANTEDELKCLKSTENKKNIVLSDLKKDEIATEETTKKTKDKECCKPKEGKENPEEAYDRKTRSTLEKAVEKPPEELSESKSDDNSKDEVIPKKSEAKRKHMVKANESYSDSETSMHHSKVRKSQDKTREHSSQKRQTRQSAYNIKQECSNDSDESFHVDVIIPRKRQLTRNKIPICYKSESENSHHSRTNIKKSLRTLAQSYREFSFSESDYSTSFEMLVAETKPTKIKKLSKTKSHKEVQSFSESDEEPLSKLTQNKSTTKGSNKEDSVSERKSSTVIKTESDKKDKTNSEEVENFRKPKRECTKRPQNYLLMFSSSDEEDYFYGFQEKSEPKVKPTKPPEICTFVPTSFDLSSKDIGRRFGKGKVNMSNEQIEKWLKDAAMAGSSVKNENDAMLKFGEKIPTETSHGLATSIDTEKLKTLLIPSIDIKDPELQKKDLDDISPKTTSASEISLKPTSIMDRKLIFRHKDKISVKRNANAFSANNESSVYAFGEDTEDVMKTPFRRPSRRPSSTATSRSEDESLRLEELSRVTQFRKPLKPESTKSTTVEDLHDQNSSLDVDDHEFYTPLQPSSGNKTKLANKPTGSMVPPSGVFQKSKDFKSKQLSRSFDRASETSEEFKYKIPSSPSASSSSSAKLYKKQNKLKIRTVDISPLKVTDFPVESNQGQLVEAPTFYPSEKEFQDPLEYIEKIRTTAEQFGICRIVPPSTFKPDCKVADDMRFAAYNQYVHKMLHRWGPNFKELMAIKKYLSTQNISLTHSPWIGGMEIDLPRLYQTVQSLGGLKEVIEKKKWPRVSEAMKIPKSAQDRVTKLDDIYCKYLLPYDTLSPAEREKLFDEVETDWAKRESKSLLQAQQNIETNDDESEEFDDEAEECIVKGRNMALNAFYRIARNTMSTWFKTPEPPALEVEQEFWRHVTSKQNHICVHSGSIDSGNWGYGFAVSKNSPFARHAWNLKVLTNNSGSVLRSMGPVMGVTVPTLHVGMVFSSCCWYRDPHSLPWIEYLHTGGNKIWYGIPNSVSGSFQDTLRTLVPNYCRNKTLWLPSDTVMVPPNLLTDNGVSLSRIVQEPGQFIIVFPKVFTSSLSTGYVVSESVYFAPPSWLESARSVFNDLRNSCEQSMFSLDRLILSIVNDARSNVDVLKQIIPVVQELCDKENKDREKIRSLGVTAMEKLPQPDASNSKKKKKFHDEDDDIECKTCRMNLHISMVTESTEDGVYCLDHAIEEIEQSNIQSNNCKLSYTYDDRELEGLVAKIHLNITNKLQKKIPNKYTGMPTLLKS